METVLNQPSTHLLYGVTKEQPFIMRAVIELEDSIDVSCLKKATECVQKRFPYLCMEIDMDSDADFRILPNDRPIVVYEGQRRLPLMAEETNYHIMAASYQDNRIFFDLNHAFADGRFCVEVTKTLLFYYLEEKYHDGIDPAGIMLLTDVIEDEEKIDPMEMPVKKALNRLAEDVCCNRGVCDRKNSCDSSEREIIMRGEREIIKPSDLGYDPDFRPTLSVFKVAEDAFMEFSKGMGASPAIVCSAISALALYRSANCTEEKAIALGVVQDLRGAFGVKKSHHNLLTFLPVDYEPKELKGSNLLQLIQKTKAEIRRGASSEATEKKAADMVDFVARILSLETRGEREQFLRKCAITGMDSKSMMVSYVGKCPMGALEPYIKSYYPVVSVYADLGVGALSLNHNFFFTIGHSLKDNRFGEEFRALLKECGLEVTEEQGFVIK